MAAAASSLLASPAALAVATDDPLQDASGPSVVEVPRTGSLEVKPADGWEFADCGALTGATPLVTACTSTSFTVDAQGAMDQAVARVAVPLRRGPTSISVDYVIRLAQPAAPDATDTDLALPIPVGSRTLIGLSDLSLSCASCTPGTAQIQVLGVEPTTAGNALVTGSHMVFAAAQTGTAQISLRLTDDLGQGTKTFLVTFHVVADDDADILGLHLSEPMPTAATSYALSDVAVSLDGSHLTLVSCGTPIFGMLDCTPGGGIVYTPTAATTTDQFSVQVTDANGRQARATVTYGIPDSPSLAPGVGASDAALTISLPAPTESADEPTTGATSAFTALMDETGAR